MGMKGSRGGSDRPQGTALTIRQMEALRKENARKAREEMQEFELDLMLTPKRPLKSVPKLRKALDTFFAEHMDDPYISPNMLAQACSYADEDALLKEAFSPNTEPAYAALLRMAYAKLEDIITAELNDVALKSCDSRGLVEILKRMDKKRDKYDPDSLAAAGAGNGPAVSVNIVTGSELKGTFEDRFNSLLSKQRGEAKDAVIIEPESLTQPEAVADGR